MTASHHSQPEPAALTDPVCGMPITAEAAAEYRDLDGRRYYFCSPGCAAAFDADPDRYRAASHGSA